MALQRTEARAATQGRPYGVIGRNSRSVGTGGDGAPPLHGYRKFLRRADVRHRLLRGAGDGASGTPPPAECLRAAGCGHPTLRRGRGRIAAPARWASSQ